MRFSLSALLLSLAYALPAPGAATLVHRYSFSEGSGALITDSVGGANGAVLGAGATWATTGQLTLPGGSSGSAAYVDLPNGIISSLNGISIESWHTPLTTNSWGRVWDFGSTTGGELAGPGGGGTGLDYLILSNSIGTDPNRQRVEWRNEDPAGGGIATFDTNNPNPNGTEVHSVVTVTQTGPATSSVSYYKNGVLVNGASMPFVLASINDVNNWLGRSNWTGDQNLNASYNEFRIYSEPLQPWEVAIANINGPDMLIPEPSRIALVALGIVGVLARRRR
ncbi:MAG: LamG-like jellyroll fold domain-containing protein [Verrucomicrobiales bacterium]